MKRRRFLELASSSSVIFAGCSQQPDSTPAPSSESTTPISNSGTDQPRTSQSVGTESPADETEPNIEIFKSHPTAKPGVINLEISVEDESHIQTIVAKTSESNIENKNVGFRTFKGNIAIQGTKGRLNRCELEITDVAGNTATAVSHAYAREFEPIQDLRSDFGAYYTYFFNEDWRWEECTDAEPAIGRYSMADREAVSRHIDLMQGFGVPQLLLQADAPANVADFVDRLEEPLPGSMPIEIKYHLQNIISWRGDESIPEAIDRTSRYYREHVLKRGNYNHMNGRPIVTLWGATGPIWNKGELWDTIQDEWGGYSGFVEHLRNRFRTDKEAYIIGMENNIGNVTKERFQQGLKEFDALTNWFGIGEVMYQHGIDSGETLPWKAIKDYHAEHFPKAIEFVRDHEMDFIPTVFYGFDDRGNNCWGENRHIPRSPKHLEEMLELADKYRTLDRVHAATFNDWAEGHALEPGSFRGAKHGTSYLEVVKEFQQPSS